MEVNSTEQFKTNHFRRRLAEMTIKFEDEAAAAGLQIHALMQKLEQATEKVTQLTAVLEEAGLNPDGTSKDEAEN